MREIPENMARKGCGGRCRSTELGYHDTLKAPYAQQIGSEPLSVTHTDMRTLCTTLNHLQLLAGVRSQSLPTLGSGNALQKD